MTLQEILQQYFEDDIEDIQAIIPPLLQELAKPLPADVGEDMLSAFLLELAGDQAVTNHHETVEQLFQVLKQHQPAIYKQIGADLNQDLVEYYIYKKDEANVKVQFEEMIQNDGYDDDMLMSTILHLVYHGYTFLVQQFITENYAAIAEKDEEDDGIVAMELAEEIQCLIVLQQYYEQMGDGALDWNSFSESVEQFDVTIYEETQTSIEHGFTCNAEQAKQLWAAYTDDEDEQEALLEGSMRALFMKEMLAKNCSFVISAFIWDNLVQYFVEKAEEEAPDNWADFFQIDPDFFNEFLMAQATIMGNRVIQVFLLVWGSRYLVDFLYQYKVLNQEQYNEQTEIVKDFQVRFKENFEGYLWKYTFIHDWHPPLYASANALEEEQNAFEQSYGYKGGPPSIDTSSLAGILEAFDISIEDLAAELTELFGEEEEEED